MKFIPSSHFPPIRNRSYPTTNRSLFTLPKKCQDIVDLGNNETCTLSEDIIVKKRDVFMSFDGLFTRAMVKELTNLLKGGRIAKVHQPYKNEIIIIVRANGKNHKLLLSAHPSYARVQITNEAYENPTRATDVLYAITKAFGRSYILEDISSQV